MPPRLVRELTVRRGRLMPAGHDPNDPVIVRRLLNQSILGRGGQQPACWATSHKRPFPGRTTCYGVGGVTRARSSCIRRVSTVSAAVSVDISSHNPTRARFGSRHPLSSVATAQSPYPVLARAASRAPTTSGDGQSPTSPTVAGHRGTALPRRAWGRESRPDRPRRTRRRSADRLPRSPAGTAVAGGRSPPHGQSPPSRRDHQ